MSQHWKIRPAVQALMPLIKHRHFHRFLDNGQKRLAATLAYVRLSDTDRIVGVFSMVHPGDNGCKRIGRLVSTGRLAKLINSLSDPMTPVPAYAYAYMWETQEAFEATLGGLSLLNSGHKSFLAAQQGILRSSASFEEIRRGSPYIIGLSGLSPVYQGVLH